MEMKYLEEAAEQFKQLVSEQMERAERLEREEQALDFNSISPIIIGTCPGDGIGPIIFEEAEKTLRFLLEKEIAAGKVEIRRIDGLTLENRLASGETIPKEVLSQLKECHVILKGPTTTPQAGGGVKNLESANVTLRRELDLFANIRPVKVPEKGIDWTFFRENTEGEYALGSRGFEIPGKLAFDFKVITDAGTRRIAKAAFEFARNNGKKQVAVITKANIMKKTDGKFLTICREVAEDYPEVTMTDWYVDIICANLINPDMQKNFQVFLMPNLYGDIITDEAAQIQGGVGTAGSANTGNRYGMFEAIHGSAPRMIEEGLGAYANPSSILKAEEMLLRHIGMAGQADRLAEAMEACDREGAVIVTGTKEGNTGKEYGDYLLEKLKHMIEG
ncbi:isocitrate/isopropylmalate family dehydrogenase [Clostridium sp. AM58-1XD]|uniref:isocitrate/isopropylmalate family dehydrogenase n=1 Tax=Clostridium sp. AM58-1XD TaxID=2292307 RepID=UPI000E4A2A90|nr:isocitrate/isopropylmalate family dehydrogenase [Clostridium sp. AM58-1XD]RGY99451.1 isocitrate/isopropylmalate dehydrogenase family protein [Clostridium sp. AM58-1XD]